MRTGSFQSKYHDGIAYQGAFQTGSEIVATTHDQHGLVLVDVFGQFGHIVVHGQNFLNLVWQVLQTLNDLRAIDKKKPLAFHVQTKKSLRQIFRIVVKNLGATGLHGNAVFAHHQGEHDQGNKLGRVRFCRGHADFGSGVDMDAAVRFATNGRADRVGNTENQGTTGFAVTQCQQSIGSFACCQKDGKVC